MLSAFRAENGTTHISKLERLTLPNAGALSEVNTRIGMDRRRQLRGRIFQIPGSSSQGSPSLDSVSIGDLPIIERTGFFTGPNLPLKEPTSRRTIGKKLSGNRRQRLRKSFTAASEVFDLSLTGGEALLRKDIFDIIRYAKRYPLFVNLNTNGTPVTPTVAQRLRDAGLDQVRVSIDSATAEVHDEFRGRTGALKATMRGIRRLLAAGAAHGDPRDSVR